MSTASNPSIRRRILASELRRLRAQSGMKQSEAEEISGLGESNLSKYETGTASVSVVAARRLLEIYGVSEERIEALLELARAARKRGSLKGIRGKVWQPLEDLIALERDATSISELALVVVPGLLQTEDYARAVLRVGEDESVMEDYVSARLERVVTLFEGETPPAYHVVMRESVLHSEVGGPAVLRAQLTHLITMAKRPYVTIHVIPNSHGAHPSMATPFTLLGFDIAPDFRVLYLDFLSGAIYRERPAEVEPYERAFARLTAEALDPAQSLEFLERILAERT